MTRLELVSDEAPGVDDGPFSAGTPLPRRLPPGRHGIPTNLVVEHQRLRLIAAMAEALAEHSYAGVTTTHVSERANVSTATFYKHFGNLWDCVLAAYVASADRLCERVEAACAGCEPPLSRLAVGIEAALSFVAAEPASALVIGAPAPLEATAVAAARRLLIARLAGMLRRGREPGESGGSEPRGLDERLIDASLAFVCARVAAGDAARLTDLAPELTALLDRPRRAA
jgi:AcrR family transcriptional regulator